MFDKKAILKPKPRFKSKGHHASTAKVDKISVSSDYDKIIQLFDFEKLCI